MNDADEPQMFGQFLLVGAKATSCPDVFVVIANACDYSPATQRTVCRGRSPRESDGAFWERVVATSVAIDKRHNRNDPWGGTWGGLIVCQYESSQLDEDVRADDLNNFKRLLFGIVESPDDHWRVRDYASSVLVRMLFQPVPASTRLQ